MQQNCNKNKSLCIFADPTDNYSSTHDEPATPLMSKLSLSQLPECDIRENVLHSVGSMKCIYNDMFTTPKKYPKKVKNSLKNECKNKFSCHKSEKSINKAILFVFGHQNISLYLLLNVDCVKNVDLIHQLVFRELFAARVIFVVLNLKAVISV